MQHTDSTSGKKKSALKRREDARLAEAKHTKAKAPDQPKPLHAKKEVLAHPMKSPRARERSRPRDNRSIQKPKNPPPRRNKPSPQVGRKKPRPSSVARKRRSSPSATRGKRNHNPRTERSHRRPLSVASDASEHNRRIETEKPPMEFRQETAGGQKCINFSAGKYFQAAALFVDAGYASLDCVRKMQEQATQYFLTDMKKETLNGRHYLASASLWTSSTCS